MAERVIIMVEANNLTDRSYELVEKIEHKKLLLTAIVIACFVLASIGIGLNAYTYLFAFHLKGALADANIALIVSLMGIILVDSALLSAMGIKKYIQIRDLKSNLVQMQLLEDTIYNEVLKSNMHKLE